jgi:hypothetical protein
LRKDKELAFREDVRKQNSSLSSIIMIGKYQNTAMKLSQVSKKKYYKV